jgi:hypothetical protein
VTAWLLLLSGLVALLLYITWFLLDAIDRIGKTCLDLSSRVDELEAECKRQVGGWLP